MTEGQARRAIDAMEGPSCVRANAGADGTIQFRASRPRRWAQAARRTVGVAVALVVAACTDKPTPAPDVDPSAVPEGEADTGAHGEAMLPSGETLELMGYAGFDDE